MKRATLAFLVALVVLGAVVSPPALTDGCYVRKVTFTTVPVSADQRAILIKNGDQVSITYSTGYTGDGSEFGWLIPVPVVPKVEDVAEAGDAGNEAFAQLEEQSAPAIRHNSRGGCFPAGTLVATTDGPRTIETLNEGDSVHAYDVKSGVWTSSDVAVHRAYHWKVTWSR